MNDPNTIHDDNPSGGASVGSGHVVGRYVLHGAIARGGMATVHFARLVGAEGFSRIVAAKRLHPELIEDPEFVAMFLDEARIASKIHHPNVVPVLDVIVSPEAREIVLVQEYVHGVPLDKMFRAARERGMVFPLPVVSAIVGGVLAGLHSAHETKDEMGVPLEVVHRDVSPQNVMVGSNGIPRLLDFGIAKAASSTHVTRQGLFKGKVAYMPPEQLRGEPAARAGDIYAVGVMLWELSVGRRLYGAKTEAELFNNVLTGNFPTITEAARAEGTADSARMADLARLEPVVQRALSLEPARRFPTAEAMLEALNAAVAPAVAPEVARLVQEVAVDYMAGRERILAANEESWRSQRRIVAAGEGSNPAGVIPGSGPRTVPSAASITVPSAAVPATRPTTGSTEVRFSTPPPRKGFGRAGLAAVVVLVGIIVVLAVRLWSLPASQAGAGAPVLPPPGNAGAAPTGAAPATATGAASAPFTVSAPVVSPPPSTPSTAGSATAAAAASPASGTPVTPGTPPAADDAEVGRAAPHVSRGGYSRPSHAAAPPPQVAPSPAPAATTNCDPPFYYEGTKKVFKPGCL